MCFKKPKPAHNPNYIFINSLVLSKKNRLTKSADIQQVVQKGHLFFSQHAGIKFLKNHQKHSRFAVITSLKISKKAVVRNRLRRKIKAIIKDFAANIRESCDIVVLTKPVLVNLTYPDLKKEIEYLFKKTGLLKHPK